MIRVSVDGNTKSLDDWSQSELRDAIEARRSVGKDVCVRVHIESGGLNLTVSTPACSSGGGGRPPTPQENEIFTLWAQRGMNVNDFKVGQLTAFLNQVKHI